MSDWKNADQFTKMTKQPVPSLVLGMGIPAVVSMLISTVYNMVDTWFVSNIGTEAVAAVGVTLSITEAISSVGYLFGMGGGTTIGLLLGAKKKEEASRFGSTAFITALLIGILAAVSGLLGLKPLMRFLGSSEAVLPYACSYARWILAGFPVMAGSLVLSTILRCEGKTNYSMLGIGIGGLLNMALDPVFIFTLGLGVGGAAIATLISQTVGLVILLSFYIAGKTETKIDPRLMTLNRSTYGRILATGTPSLCRHGVVMVATIALNTAAGMWGGDLLIAALSIVNKVITVIQAVVKGFFQGAQTSFSYNRGAKMYNRVRETFRFALLFNTGVIAIAVVFVYLFSTDIMRLFGSAGVSTAELGAWTLRVETTALLLMPLNFAGNTLMQSVGLPGRSTLLALLPQGLFYIPMLYILPAILGMKGVVWAFAAGQVLTVFATVPVVGSYFRSLPAEDPAG